MIVFLLRRRRWNFSLGSQSTTHGVNAEKHLMIQRRFSASYQQPLFCGVGDDMYDGMRTEEPPTFLNRNSVARNTFIESADTSFDEPNLFLKDMDLDIWK